MVYAFTERFTLYQSIIQLGPWRAWCGNTNKKFILQMLLITEVCLLEIQYPQEVNTLSNLSASAGPASEQRHTLLQTFGYILKTFMKKLSLPLIV